MTEVLLPFRSDVPTRASAHSSPDEVLTPIDFYLREQQQLTAVDRFAKHHDADVLPAQARWYRELIPLERPAPGQQYGFEVDLDACSGCKACVTACHRLNGLDDGEAFRTVGSLFGTVLEAREETLILLEPWQQTVTTACHHCVDPACLNGCPVDAYEKDPVTGIVRHLDDQCIGCSYCTLTCPYEVPTFNEQRGIVRKCDMCSDRLADGEAPACVQACPTSAISIAIVDLEELLAETAAEHTTLVPAAPSSALTRPTTRYRTTRPLPADALPADHFSVSPGHAHLPLTVMLVLTQMAVGAFVADLLLRRLAPELAGQVRPFTAGGALGVGLLALGASILHLGRPRYAWRAVIGIGHSWLSREIVVFSAFAGAAAASAGSVWVSAPDEVSLALGLLTAGLGLLGVFCSAKIYSVTGRRWWRLRSTAAKFFGTTAVAGMALALAVATYAAAFTGEPVTVVPALRPVLLAIVAGTVLKLAGEALVFLHLRDTEITDLRRTALLLEGDLWRKVVGRVGLAVVGGILLPLALFASWSSPRPPIESGLVISLVIAAFTLAAELIERWLFFTAVSSPRMPGGFR